MASTPTLLILHNKGAASDELMGALADTEWQIGTARLKEARHAISGRAPDCIVLALDGDGAEVESVLEIVRSYDDNLPLIVVAPDAKLEDAVAIMKAGAYDFHTLPLDSDRLKNSIAHATRLYSLTKKVFLLESQVAWRTGLDEMVGQAVGMQEVYQLVQMVARSNATVLIHGESGTGKELVAKAIHRLSPRKKKVFIDINCGAIPRELLENELFGHERGAFTGADRQYKGSCEVADGGSLFLDEISEMEPALQVKMLRFLQERSFTRVGGTDPIAVDVKVIAATNRNLEEEVEQGRFREDLFYRLNVVPIRVPPLRERQEDIPLLARHFLEKYATKYERMFIDIAPPALEALVVYPWPGNVRELENIIERVSVLNNDSQVLLKHLPPEVQDVRQRGEKKVEVRPIKTPDAGQIIPLKLVEKYAIEAALARCLGNVAEASNKLKVSQATLYRKIKQYGLKT